MGVILNRKGERIEISRLIETMKNLERGSFVSIKGYENKEGEIANFLINHMPDWSRVLVKSARKIEMIWDVVENEQHPISKIEKKATKEQEIEDLLRKSEDPEPKARFEVLTKGLQTHKGTIYLYGLIVRKTIIKEGEKKKERKYRNSITEYRDRLKSRIPTSKFRLFKLDRNFDEIVMNGETFPEKEEI